MHLCKCIFWLWEVSTSFYQSTVFKVEFWHYITRFDLFCNDSNYKFLEFKKNIYNQRLSLKSRLPSEVWNCSSRNVQPDFKAANLQITWILYNHPTAVPLSFDPLRKGEWYVQNWFLHLWCMRWDASLHSIKAMGDFSEKHWMNENVIMKVSTRVFFFF